MVRSANPPSLRTQRKQSLVLLPGALCDAALFRHQIAGLSDIADVKVGDLTRDDSISAMARRVLAAAPPRFALAGLSLGGYVALEIMRQGADRVSRLALLDTSAEPEVGGRGEAAGAAAPRAGATAGAQGASMPMTSLLVHPMRLGDRRLTVILNAMADRVGRKAFQRQQRASLERPDSRGDLAAIHCPTLLLAGRQDPLVPAAALEAMARAIAGARLSVIEECGHLSPLEKPEAVTKALREWLNTPSPA
jgi:pimeloyl-ACP methyl ester carboxylesterase